MRWIYGAGTLHTEAGRENAHGDANHILDKRVAWAQQRPYQSGTGRKREGQAFGQKTHRNRTFCASGIFSEGHSFQPFEHRQTQLQRRTRLL